VENYVQHPSLRQCHGQAARERVVRRFSLDAMVDRYSALYDEVLGRRPAA
jgi:glycosyltransferase involved in cell wall biosynthesis